MIGKLKLNLFLRQFSVLTLCMFACKDTLLVCANFCDSFQIDSSGKIKAATISKQTLFVLKFIIDENLLQPHRKMSKHINYTLTENTSFNVYFKAFCTSDWLFKGYFLLKCNTLAHLLFTLNEWKNCNQDIEREKLSLKMTNSSLRIFTLILSSGIKKKEKKEKKKKLQKNFAE